MLDKFASGPLPRPYDTQARLTFKNPDLYNICMLELLHTTEEEFKSKDATTTQMENVFKTFNITARLFDFNGKLIYSFVPPDSTTTNTRKASSGSSRTTTSIP